MVDDLEVAAGDATAQAELVRRGDVTPAELVEAAARRIEALDPAVGALVHTRFEQALREAHGELPDGPFRGVPMVLKDAVQHSAGDPYQHGTRFLRDRTWVSPADSELTRRYRAAGFVIVGRSKVPELTSATTTEPLAHGPARNPWNLDHSTGGSSGGSAAAVAAGMVPVGHANDMGGSIRIPASCCGLVGLKPTRDRMSLAPAGQYWGPLTHEHVVCHSVRDTAAILDATAGPVPGDLHTAPPPARAWAAEVGAPVAPLRVGLLTGQPDGEPFHPDCAAAAQAAGRLLEELGHAVEPVSADGLAGDGAGRWAFHLVTAVGIAQAVAGWERLLGEPVTDLEPMNATLVEHGRAVSGIELLAAIDDLAAWSRRITAAYAGYDVLLSPTIPIPPIRLGVADPTQPVQVQGPLHAQIASLVLPYDVTGQPAISLPLATGADGLPIGVQLAARHGREDVLIALASALEQAAPWSARRSPVATSAL
ncbi:amidase [Frankia sp. CNm7]|uniref:Amidase n=1 Tax=Frankia nepalensis TaxID=1836974 RepID=A0A937RJE4_9ACTN|nr:amidase family protein [Frankia nepalensis]MBL7502158.1 amidase [Frankia nepalensis]MBL7510576.1 amidase [Frankia nepalensis]MBL7523909.1 amidase [Frankia nepalensis]MBL7633363.1 amidase [Frankia nepalensis]